PGLQFRTEWLQVPQRLQPEPLSHRQPSVKVREQRGGDVPLAQPVDDLAGLALVAGVEERLGEGLAQLVAVAALLLPAAQPGDGLLESAGLRLHPGQSAVEA